MDSTVMPRWRVGVIGLGTMGSGIAQVVAQHGYSVTAVELSEEQAHRGYARIEQFLKKGVALGKTRPEEASQTLDRITLSTSLHALANHDFIIEAVFEDRSVKQAVFSQLIPYLTDHTILATNTSGLAVHAIAEGLNLPCPLIGLHFFNPPQLMRLVEVVKSFGVSSEVITQVQLFCRQIGKETVVVKDRPGFLVNRLLIPYLNQAMEAFDRQLATQEDLDVAIEQGLGYPMGPMKLLDQIGLDVHLHATSVLHQQTYLKEFRPPQVLQELVHSGRLGKKSGAGFYEYERDSQDHE